MFPLSLRGRIATSFITANVAVLVLTFIVFYHLDTLNEKIVPSHQQDKRISILTDEIRISMISLLQKKEVDSMLQECESFSHQLRSLSELYQESAIKNTITKMLSYVDSLRLFLQKNPEGMSATEGLVDKIIEAFSQLQKEQYASNSEEDGQMKKIIDETKQRMMVVLIVGFCATILLALIIPRRVALPFRKINDAVRELRDCNFDVSIYYSARDEIGELAQEMNKMIQAMKVFDELRASRITVENKKFNALANMIQRLVLVADSEGNLIYMNNRLYSLLQVQSEEVIGKHMSSSSSAIPTPIADICLLALKRCSKIENQELVIEGKKAEEGEVEGEKEKKEILFKGYATVTPIRGKESFQDYYLMVLSEGPIS